MNPGSVKISPEWREALRKEFESEYFDTLTITLRQMINMGIPVYPAGPLIFNAYNQLAPKDIKVVILGQDPYHNPGEAMGLSFSVPKGVKIPPSLKNIYKELVLDQNCYFPENGDLSSWSKQGVFLLNAFLTVEHNKAGSHRNIGWQQFTDATINYLSSHFDGIVFMLWGNFAKSKKGLIDSERHLVLEAAHPSPLAGNAFSGCQHFSKANTYLVSKGKSPVDWQIR